MTINRVGSMITVFFCDGPVTDYATREDARTPQRFGRFFHAMLERGVYLPPAQFEAAFVSLAHGEAEIDADGRRRRRGLPRGRLSRRRRARRSAPRSGARLGASALPSWMALRYSRFLLRSATGSVVVKFAPRTTSPGSRIENSPPSVSALAGR